MAMMGPGRRYWQFFYWVRFILLIVAGAVVAFKTIA